jgi:hypothetical protein
VPGDSLPPPHGTLLMPRAYLGEIAFANRPRAASRASRFFTDPSPSPSSDFRGMPPAKEGRMEVEMIRKPRKEEQCEKRTRDVEAAPAAQVFFSFSRSHLAPLPRYKQITSLPYFIIFQPFPPP